LQFFSDFNYDLRNIICTATESILKLLLQLEQDPKNNKQEISQHKKHLLKEICELIDDEETGVKIEAMN